VSDTIPPETRGPRTRDLLVDAERRLDRAGVASPRFDAESMLSHVLGVPRTRLFLHDNVERTQASAFERLVIRRMSREPLQHILGSAGFRTLSLEVGKGVFVPRPETEVVVEAALRELRLRPTDANGRRLVIDMCSGSGAIALSMAVEEPGTDVVAVEVSADAIPWLQRNVDAHAEALAAVGSRVSVVHGDVATIGVGLLNQLIGDVALVVSNPPYIPERMVPRDPEVAVYDPNLALFGGSDGLNVVRQVVAASARVLPNGGVLLVEHADVQGPEAQNGVPRLLLDAGWGDVIDLQDLAGKPRFTRATRTAKTSPDVAVRLGPEITWHKNGPGDPA
jgi:release factor glutamine methyltransferase